jgi:hypothetical protein
LKGDYVLLQVIIELNDWSWILCAAGAKMVKLLKERREWSCIVYCLFWWAVRGDGSNFTFVATVNS